MMKAGYRVWHGSEEFAKDLNYMGGSITGRTVIVGEGDDIIAIMHYRDGNSAGIKIESNSQEKICGALTDYLHSLLGLR